MTQQPLNQDPVQVDRVVALDDGGIEMTVRVSKRDYDRLLADPNPSYSLALTPGEPSRVELDGDELDLRRALYEQTWASPQRCPVSSQTSDGSLRCDRRAGHQGGHDMVEAPQYQPPDLCGRPFQARNYASATPALMWTTCTRESGHQGRCHRLTVNTAKDEPKEDHE